MMKESFTYRILAADLWQLAMYETYRSLAGMCNLIFTAAMAALALNRWEAAGDVWRGVLLLGIAWFPLVHPVLVFHRVKAQADRITADLTITVVDAGIQVDMGEESIQVHWDRVSRVLNRPTALILVLDRQHGYLLPNRVLGTRKKELYTKMAARITCQAGKSHL